MFKAATRPKEPLPLEARQRALRQGALGVVGTMVGMIGALWLLHALGNTSRAPMLLVFSLCLAGEVYGVWQLGLARDGRWDGRGILALGLMFLGYPLLFFYAGWFTMGLYVMISGQPLRIFGD